MGQEEYLEHHSEVTHARFSTSGYLIASSDADGVIKVWSASPAPLTRATFISGTGATALEWLPDSERHFLYGTRSGSVKLCDTEERKAVNEAASSNASGRRSEEGGSSCPVSTLSCSPNGSNFVCGAGAALRLHDLRTMFIQHEFSVDEAASTASRPFELTCCAFNHNSQMVLTSGTDGKMRIFDIRGKDCISSWSVTSSSTAVLGIALSADETSVYALTAAGTISSWSVYQSGQQIFEHQVLQMRIVSGCLAVHNEVIICVHHILF